MTKEEHQHEKRAHHHPGGRKSSEDSRAHSREPSPTLARMQSMGASEGVDNLRRVSGTFARSMTLTKNPLLTTVNDDDDKESPSGFFQREANISTNLEEKNAPGKKSLGRFLSLSTAKKKHKEERLREEKKSRKETNEGRVGDSAPSNSQGSGQRGEEDASNERLHEGVSTSCRFENNRGRLDYEFQRKVSTSV